MTEYVFKNIADDNDSPDIILDKMARENFNNPNGFFGSVAKRHNLKYDSLDENEKELLKYLIMNQIAEDLNLIPKEQTVVPFDKQKNIRFWSLFDTDPPTDEVVFKTLEDVDYVRNYWSKDDVFEIPIDIFISGNIPLRSILISYATMGFTRQQYDIRIFSDYNNRIKRALADSKKKPVLIGGVSPRLDSKGNPMDRKTGIVAYSLHFDPDGEKLIVKNVAYLYRKEKDVVPKSKTVTNGVIGLLLQLWYGVQITLLNPITERVFIHKRNNDSQEEKHKTNYRKPKIMYVKKYYISKDDLFQAMNRNVTHQISCTLWYVIGHWRNYKSGKRIWIDGYWKGEDRKKINKDNEVMVRERIIDTRVSLGL